ncbi:MAG: DUF445 domain-containing protein, partial [bacterium]
FIENISKLVERDIINENTLGNSLKDEEVKNTISMMIDHFFNHSLENRIDKLLIADIPGIYETVDNCINFMNMNSGQYFSETVNIIFPEIELEETISEHHFDHFGKKLIEQLIIILNSSEEIKSDTNELISKISKQEISTLVNPDLLNILSKNIKAKLQEILNDSDFIYHQLDDFISSLEKYIDKEELKDELVEHIRDKKLKDFSIDEDYLTSLLNNIQTVLRSAESQKTIELIYQNILESVDKLSLSSLLGLEGNEDYKGKQNPEGIYYLNTEDNVLTSIFKNKSEEILSIMKPWIQSKQIRIDSIFDDLIRNVLEEESKRSPWKSAIKRSAYDYYKNNTSKTPTQILESTVENILQEPAYHINLINILKDRINNIQFDKLLGKNPEFIVNYLNDFIDNIEKESLKEISDYRINELIELNHVKSSSTGKFFMDNREIKEIILQTLTSGLEKEIDSFKDSKLNDYLNINDKEIYFKKIIYFISQNKELLEKTLKTNIYNKVKNKTLEKLINPDIKENSIKIIQKYSIKFLKDQYKKNKNKKVNNLIHSFSYREGFNEKATYILIDKFNENLPLLLQGNISAAIKNNLIGVSDRDMKNIVEGFVGRELRPITFFGAFLGLCSASLLYFLQTGTDILPPLQIPLSMLVYGFIGYITNVIAIKMVFKPYDEKRLLGVRIPFTPGVVSKEKSRFAHSIGKFIDQELLNHDTIRKTLLNKKAKLTEVFTDSLSRENYLLPRELLKNNNDNISKYTLNLLKKNKSSGINYIMSFLEKPVFSDEDQKMENLSGSLANSLTNYIESNIEKNWTKISYLIIDYLEKNKGTKLSSILPNTMKTKMDKSIGNYLEEKIDFTIDLLSDNTNKPDSSALSKLIDRVYGNIKSYQISDFPEDIKKTFSRLIYKMVKKLLISQISEIKQALNEIIKSEISIFLDRIPSLISNNKIKLKNMILNEIESKMGFWSKAGQLVDIDLTLDSFSERLIDEGIPEILELFMEEKSAEIKSEILLNENEVLLLLNEFLKKDEIKKLLTDNINYLLQKSTLTLESLLKIFKIDNPTVLLNLFSEEITVIQKSLATGLKDNKKEIISNTLSIINNLLENCILNLEAGEISGNINEDLIKDTLKKIYKQINQDNRITNLFATLIREFIELNTQENKLINTDHLKEDLNTLSSRILNNSVVIDSIHDLISTIYLDIINQLDEIINNENANYLIDLLVESLLDTMENGLPELIREINIKEITVEEIENMDSREIETLFYSFAGNYFGKLEHYGWLGSIIGLLAELINLTI